MRVTYANVHTHTQGHAHTRSLHTGFPFQILPSPCSCYGHRTPFGYHGVLSYSLLYSAQLLSSPLGPIIHHCSTHHAHGFLAGSYYTLRYGSLGESKKKKDIHNYLPPSFVLLPLEIWSSLCMPFWRRSPRHLFLLSFLEDLE